jgi:hypothetical protein
MKERTGTSYKIVNKTNQTIPIINYGYLASYGEMPVASITDQMKNLEKRGLIAVRKY